MTLYSESILLLSASSNQFHFKALLTPKEDLKLLVHPLTQVLRSDHRPATHWETQLSIFFSSILQRTQAGRIEKMEVAVVKWRFCPTSGNRMWFFSLSLLCLCTVHCLHFSTQCSFQHTPAVCGVIFTAISSLRRSSDEVSESAIAACVFTMTWATWKNTAIPHQLFYMVLDLSQLKVVCDAQI